MEAWQPTALIGISGQAGCFDEGIVRTMAKHCARPVIFPFSNPTDNTEATPADLMRWTDGRVLVRWSGTEAKLRIMLEGPNEDRIRSWAKDLAKAAKEDVT